MGADFKNMIRIGIGIDRPESREPSVVAKYVLQGFNKDDQKTLDDKVFKDIFDMHIQEMEFKPVAIPQQGVKKRDVKK